MRLEHDLTNTPGSRRVAGASVDDVRVETGMDELAVAGSHVATPAIMKAAVIAPVAPRKATYEDLSIPRASKVGIAPAPRPVSAKPPQMTYAEIKEEVRANSGVSSRTLVYVFRLAQHCQAKPITGPITRFFHRLTCFVLRVDLPCETAIAPGLRIEGPFGISIHPATRIGTRCVLRHGVTLGSRLDGDDQAPIIGHDVEFGAYAVVTGKVEIEDGAKVLALSLTTPEPPRATSLAATRAS